MSTFGWNSLVFLSPCRFRPAALSTTQPRYYHKHNKIYLKLLACVLSTLWCSLLGIRIQTYA